MLRISSVALALFLSFHLSHASAQESSKENFYSLPQLKKISLQEGSVYQTEGYVIMQYECPPCPKDAVCQTCPPPYVIISARKKTIEYPDQMGANDLPATLFKGPVCELGKKYRWKLRFSKTPSFFGKDPNFEVVEAEIEK